MDAAGSTAQALAIRGNTIVEVGANDDVERLCGKNTRTIDLKGRVVLPGFIDTHVHLDCTAVNTKLATSCHIPPVDYVEVLGTTGSLEEILNFVEDTVQKTPVGEWIIGQGRFSLEVDGNSPSKGQLDEISPNHPVMIRYSAHSQLLNSKALQLAGISRKHPTQEELDEVAPRARVRRDPATGEPTGVVNECIDWIFPRCSPWKSDELRRAIRQTCGEAVRFGVTSIHELVSWPDSSRIYQELYRDGDLPLRIQLCPCVWSMQRTIDMDSLLNLGLQTGFGNDWIKFGSAKMLRREAGMILYFRTRGEADPTFVAEPENGGCVLDDRLNDLRTAFLQHQCLWTIHNCLRSAFQKLVCLASVTTPSSRRRRRPSGRSCSWRHRRLGKRPHRPFRRRGPCVPAACASRSSSGRSCSDLIRFRPAPGY